MIKTYKNWSVLFLHVFQIIPEAPVASACHPHFCQGADTAEQAGPDIWRRYSVAEGWVAVHVMFIHSFVCAGEICIDLWEGVMEPELT